MKVFLKGGGSVESNTINYEYLEDGRIYIIQNNFAGTKRLSEVLESMIELSLSQKAASQNESLQKREIST